MLWPGAGKVADLVGKIEKAHSKAQVEDSKASAEHSVESVMGETRVLAEDPHRRPKTIKKSPAPKLFYAADPAKRDRMRDDYDIFEAHYYFAADRLCKQAMLSGSENPAHESSSPWTPLSRVSLDELRPESLQEARKRLLNPSSRQNLP